MDFALALVATDDCCISLLASHFGCCLCLVAVHVFDDMLPAHSLCAQHAYVMHTSEVLVSLKHVAL